MIVLYAVRRWRLRKSWLVGIYFICNNNWICILILFYSLSIVTVYIHGFNIMFLNLLAQPVEDLYPHNIYHTLTHQQIDSPIFLFHTNRLLYKKYTLSKKKNTHTQNIFNGLCNLFVFFFIVQEPTMKKSQYIKACNILLCLQID